MAISGVIEKPRDKSELWGSPLRIQPEISSGPITVVDEKYFSSEVRRLDSAIANAVVSHDRFEKEVIKRFDQVDARFEKVDARFEKMDKRFDELRKEGDNHFLWMMGALVLSLLVPTALRYFGG